MLLCCVTPPVLTAVPTRMLTRVFLVQNFYYGSMFLSKSRKALARRMRAYASTLALAVAVGPTMSSGALTAYYTNVSSNSAGSRLEKYADIVVKMGDDQQLEFTRATAYMPLWRTPIGAYNITNLVTREPDSHFYYTYLRLLQNDTNRVVVQLRYYESISTLSNAVQAVDPLVPCGITGIVLETFAINDNHTIYRTIKRAIGTRFWDWTHPALETTATVTLLDNGVKYGKVHWGAFPPILRRPAIRGNPVKKAAAGLPAPVKKWTFDEGLKPHGDFITELVDGTVCPISGLMTEYFPGVSGAALAFDGYYTGVGLPATNGPALTNAMSVEAWVTLDNYPYNDAPFVHNSTKCGSDGWYLGVDAYGKPFFRINGITAKSPQSLAVNRWIHVVGTYDGSTIQLFVNAVKMATTAQAGTINAPDVDLLIGRNNTALRNTDPVRGDLNNLQFIYGVEGLMDQVCIFNACLTATQIANSYEAFAPGDPTSPINSGVLPGNVGTGTNFGASYTKLQYQPLWDKMWRDDNPDILIKFDHKPISIVFWRGLNYSPALVSENNIWYNDQSCEGGLLHGCAEHMADKQQRECFARIIENTTARVVIHWHYPEVDVGYEQGPLVDEYYTIYPDGTMIRDVVDPPNAFQDTQLLLSPGQNPLDVVSLQANTLMDLSGNTQALIWTPPTGIPSVTLKDARVELLNTRSAYKPFLIFTGGEISPWGKGEASPYSGLSFAGPWNHYPIALDPSDGRNAADDTRVRHFAGFGGHDDKSSCVLYGLTTTNIFGLLNLAKMFNAPPSVDHVRGASYSGFFRNDISFRFTASSSKMAFVINASTNQPLVNPCFVIKSWGSRPSPSVKINHVVQNPGPNFHRGKIIDTDGTCTMIIWVELSASVPQDFEIAEDNAGAIKQQ